MQLNNYFVFFFGFCCCFFLIINLFIKVELEHANSSSIVLTQKSSPVRFVEDVNCGTHHLKGTQPQLIPKKSTEYKSNREPSMKNAQHNTHTHETEKLGVSWKPVNLNLGKKNFYLLYSGTEATDRLVVCHSVSRQKENWFRKYWEFSV